MFGNYLAARRKSVLLFCFFTAVMIAVLSLYRLPAVAVCYACAIYSFFGILFMVHGYRNFCRRHRCLEQLKREMYITLENLPSPDGLVEKDYQEMLLQMHTDKQELNREMESRYQELVDYYTVWVHQIKTPIAAMDLMLQEGDIPEAQELKEELRQIGQYVEDRKSVV